jgi:hypothetical protein
MVSEYSMVREYSMVCEYSMVRGVRVQYGTCYTHHFTGHVSYLE